MAEEKIVKGQTYLEGFRFMNLEAMMRRTAVNSGVRITSVVTIKSFFFARRFMSSSKVQSNQQPSI